MGTAREINSFKKGGKGEKVRTLWEGEKRGHGGGTIKIAVQAVEKANGTCHCWKNPTEGGGNGKHVNNANRAIERTLVQKRKKNLVGGG